MTNGRSAQLLAFICLLPFILTSCYQPPYNNFKTYPRPMRPVAAGAVLGSAALAVASGPIFVGTALGGAVGAAFGLYGDTGARLMTELSLRQIQAVEYGDRITLIVPTDRYFVFNTPQLNEICYPGLATIVRLVKTYPGTAVYVAGFTDSIGSPHNKKMLSQAQAEAMVTFLWANGIPAHVLTAEGYADQYSVADNRLVHGSAQNRRLEIQWVKHPAQTI